MASNQEVDMANLQNEKRSNLTVVRLKPSVDKMLRDASKTEDRTFTSIIERALTDYFKKTKS
jgi:hypothetical protein